MKSVAILQSNYIPWKGYFDLIAAVDEFIIYDDMQYTRRDWRNRNKIKTPQGLQWLTVPVLVKGKYNQLIKETEIDGSAWAENHWKTIVQNYRRSKYFDEIEEWLGPLYKTNSYTLLSSLNREFIQKICNYLSIDTKITSSSEYILVEGKTLRLVDICKQAGANEYVSGMSAKEYLEEEIFSELEISLKWFDYQNYPEYNQLWKGFEHGVSIVDLLFNCGKESVSYMKFAK